LKLLEKGGDSPAEATPGSPKMYQYR